MNKKKQERYWGELIRLYCPSLYGKPIYDKVGKRIPYKIIIPKMSYIDAESLVK